MSKSKAKKLRDQARLQKHKMAGPPALPIMFSGNRVVVAKILATPDEVLAHPPIPVPPPAAALPEPPAPAPAPVLPAPRPDAEKFLAATPDRPARTQEQIDHEAQVIRRPRRDDRAMIGFAALGVSPGVKSLVVDNGGVAELGTFTYFSLARRWVVAGPAPEGGRPFGTPVKSVLATVYLGYKARRTGAQIVVGGPHNNVCAYDLRFRPFDDAHKSGKILNSRKHTTVRLGLTLDKACEEAARTGETDPALTLPKFWAAFPADDLPEVEDCQAARRAALEAVRQGYAGPVLPCLRSPGGVVTDVFREEDGSVVVGFAAVGKARNKYSELEADDAVTLPRTAVLRPYVRAGYEVAAGAPLADFLPRRLYPNMAKIAELYGPDIAEWLLAEAVAASDEELMGFRCRRVEMCSTQLDKAVKLYEDVRHMLAADGTVRPQVVRVRTGPGPLQPGRDGVVVADFVGLRPEWMCKFEAAQV